jgi:hypothetical protein
MTEYSECCGAERHYVWSDLCSACLEQFAEAEEES